MNLRLAAGDAEGLPHPVSRLVGSKTGIVRNVLEYLPDRSDPAVFNATAVESAISAVAPGAETGSLDAGGTGLTRRDSLLRAIGEAAERYCLFFPDGGRLVRGSHADLTGAGRSVVGFSSLDVFERSRLDRVGLRSIDQATELVWQPGVDLLTGEQVLLPAQWVWLVDDSLVGPRWYPTTSNGTACAPTFAGAVLGAITERIERDAVMRTWYRHRVPTSLALEPDSTIGRLVHSRFETPSRSVHFIELESPVDVPVVGSIAVDHRERAPKFVIGGDAAVSIRSACRGSLLETAQSWAYLKDLLAQGRDRAIDPTHIYNLEDNLIYYAMPEQFDEVTFLLEGDTRPVEAMPPDESAVEPPIALARLLGALDKADLTPIAVDVTTRDITAVGLYVVRVVIPELLDLALPSLPPVGHPALADATLTDKPHPYP